MGTVTLRTVATGKTTIDFILQKLGKETFSARAMFGEYALYAHGRLSALVCNDRLYVKIVPASGGLEGVCDKDTPYPAAKLYYVVDESQLSTLPELRAILCAVAAASSKRGMRRAKVGGEKSGTPI